MYCHTAGRNFSMDHNNVIKRLFVKDVGKQILTKSRFINENITLTKLLHLFYYKIYRHNGQHNLNYRKPIYCMGI